MESANIECISVSDAMVVDDDEVAHVPHPFLKPQGDGSGTVAAGGRSPVMSPATRVHELLECPVCTNSMYPPIHQVGLPLLDFPSVLTDCWGFI
ncbi:hypothetical protein BHE74_00032471 [Ensete ventricosum]|nr:hypothetical protein BHE74_00032471 [Ensete ventricosum]